LKAIASSASNSWGLFLLVFMLGYGLVSVPQSLWAASCKGHSLNNAYFKVAKLSQERNSAEESLDDVLEVFSDLIDFFTLKLQSFILYSRCKRARKS